VYHFVHARTSVLQKVLHMLRANATRKDALPLQGLLKILIGFYQVLSSFISTFPVRWPDEQEDLMKTASVLPLTPNSKP